jgi:hypothetical protein
MPLERTTSCGPPGINKALYQIATQDTYRLTGQIVPYCQNRFDQLVFTPNPEPAFSSLNPRVNGAFDQMADMIRQAIEDFQRLFDDHWAHAKLIE